MYGAVESSVVVNGGCCAESSEEGLSVLPRHTKVLVTGNNRTKPVLVGLQGVVKKAVGLGGWHWLVLTNGIEVKLQRNALSVIEAPTGQDDEDTECENMQWNIRDLASDDRQKPHRPRDHPHKTIGSPDKTMSHANSCDSQYMESISPPQGATKVDFSKLETEALWKYWRHFDLVEAIPNPSKEELIDIVQRHFMSQDAMSAIVKQEMHLDDNDDDDESLLNREELQQSNHTRMINNPKAESKERQGVADDKAKDVIRKTIILKRRPPRIDNKSSIPRNFVKHPSNPQSHPATMVDFSKLEESSLRRYCRYYKLVGRGLKIVPKEDLVCVVRRHFLSQRLDEVQVLDEFAQAFKKLKNAT